MSIFRRLFRITKAETHAIVDKFEDPIKMTEQGIRDLKKDLEGAMASLAEVKGMAIRTRKQAEDNKKAAVDYERKAMMLLRKMQDGELDPAEAERLATEALNMKESRAKEAVRLTEEANRHDQMAGQIQANVNKIKSTVTTYENELVTLKARAKTAASTKKLNRQISQIDSSGTIAMLEKMKAKVEEDESLAEAYGEIQSADQSVDNQINAVLESGKSPEISDKLAELKQKMGISYSPKSLPEP